MKPKIVASSDRHLEWLLHANHPLSLTRARGRWVQCLSGRIWITVYNDASDFELLPGDIFIIPNAGLTLIEAIDQGRIRVQQRARLQQIASRVLASFKRAKRSKAGSAPGASPALPQ